MYLYVFHGAIITRCRDERAAHKTLEALGQLQLLYELRKSREDRRVWYAYAFVDMRRRSRSCLRWFRHATPPFEDCCFDRQPIPRFATRTTRETATRSTTVVDLPKKNSAAARKSLSLLSQDQRETIAESIGVGTNAALRKRAGL